MKNLCLLLFTLLFFYISFAQKPIPNISIQDINNQNIETQNLTESGLIILTFWATWCIPCIDELSAIHEVYADWQHEFNLILIAVSIDDNRTISRVKPMVNSHEWDYEIWLDKNQEFKRALQISNIPYLLIVKNGNIVFQHTGYKPGNEELLYSKIREFSN